MCRHVCIDIRMDMFVDISIHMPIPTACEMVGGRRVARSYAAAVVDRRDVADPDTHRRGTNFARRDIRWVVGTTEAECHLSYLAVIFWVIFLECSGYVSGDM